MSRNLRAFFARVKLIPRRRPENPHQIIARLEARASFAEAREAELERRNRVLAEESLGQAGYIRFLTGKCVSFECDRLVRATERGEVVS
jgi:hypothetical protein